MDMTKRALQYHIGLGPGDAGGWCILPGDPGRCQSIAAYFDEPGFRLLQSGVYDLTGTLEGSGSAR